MKFTAISSDPVFGRRMKAYAEEKLTRPVLRHHLDSEETEVKCEGGVEGTSVVVRVSVFIPGEESVHLSTSEEGISAAIDVAADRLERALRSMKAKKRARRNQVEVADFTEEISEDDFLTDGEEEALREMGALDAVLGN